jgi:hypothetical protein
MHARLFHVPFNPAHPWLRLEREAGGFGFLRLNAKLGQQPVAEQFDLGLLEIGFRGD